MSDIMSALKDVHAEPLDLLRDSFEWKTEDYEWDIVTIPMSMQRLT